MTIRSANLPFVIEPELRSCSDRQVKPIKSQSMLAVGLRRFRTLSGVSQKRSHQQRPPLPPIVPMPSSERSFLHSPQATVSEQKQEPVLSSAKPCDSNSHITDTDDTGPFSPCVSHLQGIHFVRDANQDPDLDADESTLGWPQSAHSEKSSTISATEHAINRLSGQSHSFSMTWSDQFASSSPTSVTPSEGSSSMSDSSLISRILEKIPPKLLSVRAGSMASPPIDCESPYAPHAPTSPLSASINPDSQVPAHSIPAIPFNIRSALRGTLPSKSLKIAAKRTTLHQPQAAQHPQVTGRRSALELNPSSAHDAHSPKTLPAVDSGTVSTSGLGISLNYCSSPTPGPMSSRASCSAAREVVKTEKFGLRFPGKLDYLRRHSTSPGSSIPFPGSDRDDEEVPQPTRERTRSQSSTSHFRNHLNNLWNLPINRLRTSSSLSTVIRGIRPGKHRSPSDASFEARPFSMRSESSYEILDSSAIPSVK